MNKIHPKLSRALIDFNGGYNTVENNQYPFYAYFAHRIKFISDESIPTAGVNVDMIGMNFYFNPKFIDGLTYEQSRFLIFHELFHLLFNHGERSRMHHYDHQLANIAMDMVINHIISVEIPGKGSFWDWPRTEDGKNTAVLLPKEYPDNKPLIFEHVYAWLKNKQDEKKQSEKGKGKGNGKKGQSDNQSQGQGQSENQDDGSQGQGQGDGFNPSNYGKNGKNGDECASLDDILDNPESYSENFDSHIEDDPDVTQDQREATVKSATEESMAKMRGTAKGEMEAILNKLRKPKKDPLKAIKSGLSQITGTKFIKRTIKKMSRKRHGFGIKGKTRYNTEIVVLLDTSGSMSGDFEKVLSVLFQKDIACTIVQCDTRVHIAKSISSMKELEDIKLNGLGGTILQPGIDHIANDKKLRELNLCILTDGYTDQLDLDVLKSSTKVMIVTTATDCPIKSRKKPLKQIHVDKDVKF